MDFRLMVLQIAQPPIWAKDMRFCLKLLQGLYYKTTNQDNQQNLENCLNVNVIKNSVIQSVYL